MKFGLKLISGIIFNISSELSDHYGPMYSKMPAGDFAGLKRIVQTNVNEHQKGISLHCNSLFNGI